MRFHLFATAFVLFTASLACTADKPPDGRGERFEPERRELTDDRLRQLRAPDGFRVNVFAKDLGEPRMLSVAPDGTVYVTLRNQGEVAALNDRDGDGVAEQRRAVVRGLEQVHGIAIHDGRMMLAAPTKLWSAPMNADGSVGEPKLLLDDLPKAGRHGNRTLAFGPDGAFYISVGSSSDAEAEANPEHATILRASADGSGRKVFTRGLRNTIGFGWHPQTKQMWGMDHGSDWRGDDLPPEELNLLEEGKDYGWPFVYGDQVVDTITDGTPPGGLSREQYAKTTAPMVLGYQAHSAPMQMAFYTGDGFPAEYRNDAFVAMRGSWNRTPPAGYKVVRVRFDKQTGQPTGFDDFVTGWLIEGGKAHFARLAGVAVAKDGSLLVSDDTNGVIYRVAYEKAA